MPRKQRKLQPWRRFGFVIVIIIKFGELLLWFSPRIINGLRSYIKHLKGCSSDIQTPWSWLKKKTRLRLVFSTTSRCLDIGWNTLPCVWYITWNCSIYDYQPNPKCLSWTTVLNWLVITDLCCSNNITLKLANQLISRAWLTTRLKNNSSLHCWKIASGKMVGKSIIGRITRTWMIGKLGLGGELLY